MTFYAKTVEHLVQSGVLQPSDKILVLAGGDLDRQVLLNAGLKHVVISNLEYHSGHTDYSPFQWLRVDAEDTRLDDESFDWAIVHAGLHHLGSPAKGVCEMARVARKGVLCIEARDSLLMRVAVWSGLTTDYELEPALLSDGKDGGYRNGPIPNYVYRWTEREFEKVVNSYIPSHRHSFFYRYGFDVPLRRFAMARSPSYRAMGYLISKITHLAEILVPRQGNNFAFGFQKSVLRQPWLTEALKFDPNYLNKRYDKAKY